MSAEVDLTGPDSIVPNAGELVDAAAAAVLKSAETPGLQTVDVEVVAAFGFCAEEAHDRLPFPSVGLDPQAEQVEGHDVGRLVGHGLRQKALRLTQ